MGGNILNKNKNTIELDWMSMRSERITLSKIKT